MVRAEVAPGDGALRTWMAVWVWDMAKSCTRLPFLSMAWARTPAPGEVRSSIRVSGTRVCSDLRNELLRMERYCSLMPDLQ